ncbi:lytic transglycosylase domain-containing protein [Qipengyuania sp. RS5-5]|uniref:Lytic transglycosylase domain-containing protein n=2 Tax=Parerythrobacter lacustris TaxID=2969984 RepID=A0ABT1XSB3_9SPHN|nr:lytic transglycosylase domain-containing protein [Parerythrobacter lacustris]MCR2834531.1 lytic transglycosylase domain-containing protein [Parerythrobacter lacustris]
MVARAPAQIDQAISRWEYLDKTDNLAFNDYADFILAYPGFPRQEKMQRRAEAALAKTAVSPAQVIAFFDRNPPLTNPGRSAYALALASLQRPEATETSRSAWRGGTMPGTTELTLEGLFGTQFTADDQRARMDSLLWQGDREGANRQLIRLGMEDRAIPAARLQTQDGGAQVVPAGALNDPGFVYDQAKYYRSTGQTERAAQVLTTRPPFVRPANDPEAFVGEMLRVAKASSAGTAARIAGSVDDLFPAGYDVSNGSFVLRDRYTDLMWLGGTKALWSNGDGRTAAPLFYRYGTAAKTPLTRSKGFFWAGRAANMAGDRAEAERYWNLAAQYPDYYYGQLALSELGRSVPGFSALPAVPPTPAARAEFDASPAVRAIRALANNRRDWRVERAFFEAVADQARSPAQMAMVADLARQTGLNEMAVVAGMTAGEHGLTGFERLGFPTVETHGGANWTMVHAIARQESEFDRNRVSHAGARGMMQLMPGTAREEAGKIGVQYLSADLTGSPSYNIRLGDAHFARLMDRYGGAYPLAIAAYNAGPGRVNEWLRLNGDPRTGAVDWVTWVEKIPANFETRYYVMRVIGNAVTYANMNPDRSSPAQRDVKHYLPR